MIINAFKYGEGRPVRLRVGRDGESALLVVEDQGVGIAEADQDRVFGRFERAASAEKVSGLGLGLSISEQIVQAHGGRIGLQSQPGKGSAFTVNLPLSRWR